MIHSTLLFRGYLAQTLIGTYLLMSLNVYTAEILLVYFSLDIHLHFIERQQQCFLGHSIYYVEGYECPDSIYHDIAL